jgi:hypothetical protein
MAARAAAALVAGALMAGAAAAELTPEQKLMVLQAKIETQAAKDAATKVLEDSKDKEARRAAHQTIENLQNIYDELERILKNGQ